MNTKLKITLLTLISTMIITPEILHAQTGTCDPAGSFGIDANLYSVSDELIGLKEMTVQG